VKFEDTCQVMKIRCSEGVEEKICGSDDQSKEAIQVATRANLDIAEI